MNFYKKTKALGNVLSSLLGQSKNLRKKYLSITSVEELAIKHYRPSSQKTLSLDLGCGNIPRNPFKANELYGVDIRGDLQKDIRQADLSVEPIPFDDSTFDFCTAFDFIEHIP